jgi:molybdopterin synthase sulfur carrier subunit
VKILYFAEPARGGGQCAGEELACPPGWARSAQLRSHLAARGEGWQALAKTGRNVRAALNQKMAAMDAPLDDGDEVAFFPPVTGG